MCNKFLRRQGPWPIAIYWRGCLAFQGLCSGRPIWLVDVQRTREDNGNTLPKLLKLTCAWAKANSGICLFWRQKKPWTPVHPSSSHFFYEIFWLHSTFSYYSYMQRYTIFILYNKPLTESIIAMWPFDQHLYIPSRVNCGVWHTINSCENPKRKLYQFNTGQPTFH